MENEPKNEKNEIEHVASPQSELELQRIIEGVHLGNDGHGHFTDEARASVPEAGIAVKVWQNSVGTTGIEATALAGKKIEAAALDDNHQLIWKEEQEGRQGLPIAIVEGNISQLPLEEWKHAEKIGNEGTQWGVIRVTSEDGSTQHYMVAAEFTGVVDDWTVRAGLAAIAAPENAAELQTLRTPQLSPREQ